MKYGALLLEDWNPIEEGYQEGYVAIVLLNNDGTVALDELTYNTVGLEVGVAIVHSSTGQRTGRYYPVPIGIYIDRVWDTEWEAFQWAQHREERDRYIGTLEGDINTELEMNVAIDELHDTSRWRREFRYLITALLIIIAILLVAIVIVLAQRGL